MLAVVVPMAGASFAGDVQALIAWRFVQGLLLPPIFAVTVAYIGDEWPARDVAGVAGIYIAGSSIGGFCGRFVPGVLADIIGWRGAFLALAGALARRRGHGGGDAAARERLRAHRGAHRLGAADAAPSQESAASGHLCDRLRHPVQLPRRVHLCELSPCRPALPVLLDLARRDFRDLPGRHRDRADDRLGDQAAGTPALDHRRDRGMGGAALL